MCELIDIEINIDMVVCVIDCHLYIDMGVCVIERLSPI